MKNTLFICTHYGSNVSKLISNIESDIRIQVFELNHYYGNVLDLDVLYEQIHRLDDSSSIYCDVLYENHSLSCKPLCKCCKFLFFFEPYKDGMCPKSYYLRRLQWMKEYYKRCGSNGLIYGKGNLTSFLKF